MNSGFTFKNLIHFEFIIGGAGSGVVGFGASPSRRGLTHLQRWHYLDYVGHKERQPGHKEHAQQDAQGQAGLQGLPAMLGG